MAQVKVRFNSKSHSPLITKANHLAEEHFHDIDRSPEGFLCVSADSSDLEVVELLKIVKNLKGTELFLNDERFDNIDLYCVIVDCSQKMICKGICGYLPHRWNTIFTALNLTENDRDTLQVVTENIFNIRDNPDILVTTTTDDFTIRRDILLKDLDKSLDCYSQLCDKFSKNYYIEKVSALPEEITLKRVDYTLVRQKREQRRESEVEENIDNIVSRIGDEFENRLRKVFSEYFKKQ